MTNPNKDAIFGVIAGNIIFAPFVIYTIVMLLITWARCDIFFGESIDSATISRAINCLIVAIGGKVIAICSMGLLASEEKTKFGVVRFGY